MTETEAIFNNRPLTYVTTENYEIRTLRPIDYLRSERSLKLNQYQKKTKTSTLKKHQEKP